MRFICEWCHQQVPVVDRQKPYVEVEAHFTACARRSPATTAEQVAGLAAHITAIIADREERRMRQAG
ncbi:MAG: hypothetical protein NVSMB68_01290 [Thermoanaerobaculia bacterium]